MGAILVTLVDCGPGRTYRSFAEKAQEIIAGEAARVDAPGTHVIVPPHVPLDKLPKADKDAITGSLERDGSVTVTTGSNHRQAFECAPRNATSALKLPFKPS